VTAKRYNPQALVAFARALFHASGCDDDKAGIIAHYLVEGDLMGHTTHGLAQAPDYLAELKSGAMRVEGSPEVVSDRNAAVTWDGDYLPGVWLTAKAIDLAVERAAIHGSCSVAIRRSHHIACLATFLPRATDQGMMVMLASSDPSSASIAPFGGLAAVFTPDPLAVGIPTDGDPILIDMSSSITTNGATNRLRREGRRFPGRWAMTAAGEETDDPNVLAANPPGTLLPTGGVDHGHKGYGMALTVEALTQGLSGFGRAEAPTQWGASVFVQVFDPHAFGGNAEFMRETSWIATACRASRPAPGLEAVRLPGERALRLRREAYEQGATLYPGVLENLKSWAERLGVQMPTPI
jgi:LDH2 family malate/lactate/ureidoglycolate dehydrogenase